MAKKTIGLNVDVPTGKAEEEVQSLTTRLGELKDAMGDVDRSSPQFAKMAKEAAEMQRKITDVDNTVNNLASDTKNLEGITATMSGVAGAFAAAQGAAALMSDENEQLAESLMKVQAALTLLNGVQEIANQLQKDSAASLFLSAKAQQAYNLAVGKSQGVLKAFRLALVATGIGALAVVLGAIIANWDKVKIAIEKVIGPMEGFGETFNKIKSIAMGVFDAVFAYFETLINIMRKAIALDFEGAVNEAKNLGSNISNAYKEGFEEQEKANAEAKQRAIIEATIGDTKRLIERLQAQGKETYATRKKLLEDELQLLEEGSDEYKDKLNEITVLQLSQEKKVADERNKIAEEARRKRQEQLKKQAEEQKAANQKRIEEEKKKQEEINQIIEEARVANELAQLSDEERELRQLEMEYEKKLEIVGDNEQAIQELTTKYLNQTQAVMGKYRDEEEMREAEHQDRLKKEKEEADKKRLEAEKAYRDNLRALAVDGSLSLIQTLTELNNAFAGESEQAARKQFNIQKALSLAETVISTYSAAQKAYASQLSIPDPSAPVRAAVAAGIAVAAGLARVAAISSQQFQPQGGAMASAPRTSTGSIGGAQGTPQLTQDIQRTRTGATDTGELKLKVFVTESDISRTQTRVDAIERKATVE